MSGKSTVLHFIEKERANGASDQQITHQLLDAGWHMDIIHNALNHDNEDVPQQDEAIALARPQWQSILMTPYGIAVAVLGLILIAVFI